MSPDNESWLNAEQLGERVRRYDQELVAPSHVPMSEKEKKATQRLQHTKSRVDNRVRKTSQSRWEKDRTDKLKRRQRRQELKRASDTIPNGQKNRSDQVQEALGARAYIHHHHQGERIIARDIRHARPKRRGLTKWLLGIFARRHMEEEFLRAEAEDRGNPHIRELSG